MHMGGPDTTTTSCSHREDPMTQTPEQDVADHLDLLKNQLQLEEDTARQATDLQSSSNQKIAELNSQITEQSVELATLDIEKVIRYGW